VDLITADTVSPTLSFISSAPSGVPHLDHVFVIMMENHAYKQIIDNPNEPFVNQ
jgi:hypothetical protein